MDARGSERSFSRAVLGIAALIVASALVPFSIQFGSVRVDAVVIGVPFALAMSLPFVLRRGVGDVRWSIIGWFGAVFALFAAMSIVFNPSSASAVATLVRYLSYFALTLLVGLVGSDEPARRLLMWVVVASGVGTVAVSAYQVVTGQAAAGMTGLGASVGTRVSGTLGNANFYGEFLVMAFAVALALVILQKGRARLYAGAGLLAMAGALFLTYTRGSWLALAFALAVSIPFVSKRLFLPLVAGAAVAIVAIPGILPRVLSIFSTHGSATFRFNLWHVAGSAILAKPVFGWGLGEFLAAYRATVIAHPALYMGYLGYGAHNAYFTLVVETGLLGGVAFILLVFFVATRGLFVAYRQGVPYEVRVESVVLGTGLIAFAVNALTSNSFQHPQAAVFFWIVAGLLVGASDGWLSAPSTPVRGDRERVSSSVVLSDSLALRAWNRTLSSVGRVWYSSVAFRIFVAGHPTHTLEGGFLARYVRPRS